MIVSLVPILIFTPPSHCRAFEPPPAPRSGEIRTGFVKHMRRLLVESISLIFHAQIKPPRNNKHQININSIFHRPSRAGRHGEVNKQSAVAVLCRMYLANRSPVRNIARQFI